MGIFSSDEEPMWNDVFARDKEIEKLKQENKKLKDILKAVKELSNEQYCMKQGCRCSDEDFCLDCIKTQLRKLLN